MKSFIWFTTVLLLCIELAHAAHIAPIHGHKHPKRSSNKRTPKGMKKRANRTCHPPTTNSSSDPSNSQVNAADNGGFPSLDFKMPSSVPSSLDGWWSDYTSEIGFLGFSYAVAGCMSLDKIFMM